MKTTLKHYLIPLAVLWALITTAHPEVGPTPLPTGKQILGHHKKSEDVIKATTDVVVGYFTKLGGAPGGDSDYQSYYEGAEINVISTMKGHFAGEIEVRYNLFNKPGPHEEGRPDLGVKYIMFIDDRGGNEYQVMKILPATGDTIAAIKSLIAVQVGH